METTTTVDGIRMVGMAMGIFQFVTTIWIQQGMPKESVKDAAKALLVFWLLAVIGFECVVWRGFFPIELYLIGLGMDYGMVALRIIGISWIIWKLKKHFAKVQ